MAKPKARKTNVTSAKTPEAVIREAVGRVAKDAPEDFSITVPDQEAHGDYATNVAFLLAKKRKQEPYTVAKTLAEHLWKDEAFRNVFEKVEVASPAFLNMYLSPQWLLGQVSVILQAGKDYGRQALPKKKQEKVQVEFISANPTGPLTVGNARLGSLGDTLANVLEAAGHATTREYYVNDVGGQIKRLGASTIAQREGLGHKVSFPSEELYQGEYIKELAQQIELLREEKDDIDEDKLINAASREAVKIIIKGIKQTVRKAGIRFDVWFSEKSLHKQGLVEDALKRLKRKRLVEERDGAVWLTTTELQQRKEGGVVLVKSDGEPTYLLSDIAYHIEKFERRKFDRVIDVVGADHHGEMRTLSSALEALGLPAPEVITIQLVRLVENGKEVKMSKRAGTFVTFEELLDEVGRDAVRFFFLMVSPNTHMDFDLGLAKERSEKNPVYYVQYAHARIASMLRKAEESGYEQIPTQIDTDWQPSSSEAQLLKQLVRLPELVSRIAENYEVHHLTTYSRELATAFHAFYRDCRVISEDIETTKRRLALSRAAQTVLKNTLSLMGIRAPDKM